MKINRILAILLLLGFSVINIYAMEQEIIPEGKVEEEEKSISFPNYMEGYSLLFENIQKKLSPEIQIKILMKVLTEDPEKIEKGIEYLRVIEKTALQNVVNDQYFINWAIQTISNVLKMKKIIEAAIKLRLPGAAKWLEEKAKTDSEIKAEINNKLFSSVENNLLYTVMFLLTCGIDVNCKDQYKHTPLMRAVVKNNQKIVKLLLDKNAAVDSADIFEQTPLMFSVTRDNTEIVKMLLEKGADLYKTNNEQESAYDMGMIHGSLEISKLIMNKTLLKLDIESGPVQKKAKRE